METEKEEKLCDAAGNGQVEEVRVLLPKGVAKDCAHEEWKGTPACNSARHDSVDVARLLIEIGADNNKADEKDGMTPLGKDANNVHVDVVLGNDNVTKHLIDVRAGVNHGDSNEGNRLHWATKFGHDDVAKQLIDAGADINEKDEYGGNPLHWAAKYGRENVTKHLIDAEADINNEDQNGGNPLHLATKFGHPNVVKCLINAGIDINKGDKHGGNPLHWAAKYGHENVAKELIDAGADVSQEDGNGGTPLHWAAKFGHQNVAKHLIEAGADINNEDKNGGNPLHWAAKFGHQNMVKFLIDAGIDINKRDKNGGNPLHWAAKFGNDNVAKQLIDAGADISQEDKRGETPLRWASVHGKGTMVTVLIYSGADPNMEEQYNDVIQALPYTEPNPGKALCFGAKEMDYKMVETIFKHIPNSKMHKALLYFDKNHKNDALRKTPIEWALSNKDKNIITLIMQKEHKIHEDKKDEGLRCLKSQLTHDEDLKSIIRQFTDMYKKTRGEKFMTGLLAIIPVLISFATYLYDVFSDSTLSSDYNMRRQSCWQQNDPMETQNATNSNKLTVTKDDFGVAFLTSITLIIVAFMPSYAIVLTKVPSVWRGRDRLRVMLLPRSIHKQKQISDLTLFLILISVLIVSPLFLFVTYIILKCKHSIAEKKGKARKYLDVAEYYWGIITKVECGIEASCQLILQIWLIAPTLLSNSNKLSIGGVIKGALLLSEKDADRSTGKILVALITLVLSTGSCYMFDKKKSVRHVDMIPLHVSRLSQIAARITALLIFFSSQRDFAMWFPIMFLTHITLVLIIKLTCEHDWCDKRSGIFKRIFITLVSCAASTLIYVAFRPMPCDAQKTLKELLKEFKQNSASSQDMEAAENQIVNREEKKSENQGTFSLHFYFLLLTFGENLFLSMSPIIIDHDINIIHFLNENGAMWPPMIIFGLWVVSCLGNLLFYRALHPWGEVNGPKEKSCKTLFCSCL